VWVCLDNLKAFVDIITGCKNERFVLELIVLATSKPMHICSKNATSHTAVGSKDFVANSILTFSHGHWFFIVVYKSATTILVTILQEGEEILLASRVCQDLVITFLLAVSFTNELTIEPMHVLSTISTPCRLICRTAFSCGCGCSGCGGRATGGGRRVTGGGRRVTSGGRRVIAVTSSRVYVHWWSSTTLSSTTGTAHSL